ncbi:MAG: hypothetical protein JST00_17270 [Deltaproteobacteria bacterium]|nr:hypothetical protein [Deltaproteobacteria bacterium]
MLNLFVRRHSPQKIKHLKGLVRAGVYLGALGLVFGAIQVRSARAEVKNKTLEMGRQMRELANATVHDVNRITLNGQAMFLGSSAAEGTVSSVLDRYHGYCQKNLAQPAESWRKLAESKEGPPPEDTLLGGGVLRTDAGDEGTVVCFTKSANSKPTTAEAFKTFGETGELGAIGGLRYVYAYKSQKGTTVVLTAWTDDKFNLVQMVPEDGKDAAGADFTGLPRPDGTQRVLSAVVEGTPFGVNLYRGGSSPEKVMESLDGQMHERGWFTFDTELQKRPEFESEKNKPLAHVYEKDGMVLTVTSHRDDQGVLTAFGLAGVTSTDGTRSVDGRKAVDMSPSERARASGEQPKAQSE